jgi:superfamily I DNA and RNA helicase
MGEKNMKKSMITLACAMIAPIAFAQTSTTTQETTTSTGGVTTTETSTTYSAGTVTTYEPNKTIVVKGEEGPVSFALGTAARIVDGAGKIVTAPLRSGQKVRVYYTGPTEKRVVERVQVED